MPQRSRPALSVFGLSFLIACSAFFSIPATAQEASAALGTSEEAPMTLEEAREEAAKIREQFLEEAKLLEFEAALRIKGADREAAAELAQRVREFFEAHEAPVALELMSVKRAEEPHSGLSRQQAEDLGRQLRDFYQQQGEALVRQKLENEGVAEKGSCSTCIEVLDDCLMVVDGIIDACYRDVSDPRWCLDLQRDLLRTCFNGLQGCLGNCSV